MAPDVSDLPVRIGVCIDADELFGAPTGLQECAEIMRCLNFRATILRLAYVRQAIGAEFSNEPVESDVKLHKYAHILSAIASKSTVKKAYLLAKELAKTKEFHAFSDQALLAAIELAGGCCSREGGRDFANPEDLDLLARVVFSLQGASFSPQFKRMARGHPAWDEIPEEYLQEIVRNHLAHNDLGSAGNGVARLFAMATEPAITDYFYARTQESLQEWVFRRLGMTLAQYLRAAFIVGACATRYRSVVQDLSALGFVVPKILGQIDEEDRKNVQYLLNLATIAECELGRGRLLNGGLTNYLYNSVAVRIHPIIDIGDYLLPTTLNGVLEKLMVGIPHLIDAAARAIDPDADISKVRLKFGHVFEGYLGMLLEKWLKDVADVKVLTGYRDKAGGTDWDVLIIRGETAYYFEAKAKVFTLGLRMNGAFEALDQMLLEALRRTWDGAQQLLSLARCPDAPAALCMVRKIVPCLVVFDRVPLRFPYLERYERHVEGSLGVPIFNPADHTILPVQTFEIEGIESWEEYFDMHFGSSEFFDYLEQRAIDPLTRHDRKFPHSHPERLRTLNGPVQSQIYESRRMFEALGANILQRQNA